MKTRIVYPQLWLDDKFSACSVPTKLLFCYLINNLQLGLSRYLHITDRQIMFDTGLTVNQLETGKKELEAIKWCFFTDNWVYQNHKAAYIDYTGRDRVIGSKDAEIAAIPEKIKEVFNGLISGNKPVTAEVVAEKKEATKPEASLKFLKEISQETVDEFTKKYNAQPSDIRKKALQFTNYCESKGRKYANYKAALHNACLNDFGLRKAATPIPTVEEQFIPVSTEKMDALRKQVHGVVATKAM